MFERVVDMKRDTFERLRAYREKESLKDLDEAINHLLDTLGED